MTLGFSLLRRVQRRQAVVAQLCEPLSWRHQRDEFGRGSLHRMDELMHFDGLSVKKVESYDAVCPGCGIGVGHLMPDKYPISPDLSCPVTITWGMCCGQSWRLRGGVWERV